jgi:hypothetical protein
MASGQSAPSPLSGAGPSLYLRSLSTSCPVTESRMRVRVTSSFGWRSARAVMMAFLERGAPSLRSSRTAGAVWATMASISAEPESGDVRLLRTGASLLCDMQAPIVFSARLSVRPADSLTRPQPSGDPRLFQLMIVLCDAELAFNLAIEPSYPTLQHGQVKGSIPFSFAAVQEVSRSLVPDRPGIR